MDAAYFRFYAGLNDFLPPQKRQVTFAYPFKRPVSVKHLIESAGIPHTEVEVILANGDSVDFSYLVRDGDRVSVYPVFSTIDVSPLVRLRPSPPNPHRFILDVHLGQLTTYLRLLGFDALYQNSYDDAELAQIAYDEKRILLTRDRGLLKRGLVIYGCCLHSRNPKAQLQAVLHRFGLHSAIHPWRRCLRCNGRLHPIAKETVMHRLEPRTKLYYHEFSICQDCDQIYWKGSHYGRMQQFIASIVGQTVSLSYKGDPK